VLTDTVPQRGGDTPVSLTTRFAYNPSGTINTVTDAKWQQTTFGYDASDRKTSMTYHGGSEFQSWTYDDAGNLRSRTTVGASPTPVGKTQSFKYDNLNRKIEMRWSNTAEWAQFGYDDASRLTSAKNGTGAWNTNVISTVTRQYDAAGQLTLDQQAVTGLAAKSVNYVTYDYDGKLTRMNVTGASYDYTFSYDAMGRFEKISPNGGGTAFQYYYDAASNETQRYNYLNGGVKQIYARDSLNRMSRLDVKKGDTPLSAEVYTYDRMSRLTGVNRWPENRQDLFGYYLDGEMYWAQYGVTGPQMPGGGGDPDQDTTDTTDPWSGWAGDPEAQGVPPPEDQGEPPPALPPELTLPAARNVTYSYDRGGNRVGMNDNGNPIWYTTNLLNQYTGVTGNSVANGTEHQIGSFNTVNYTYRYDERLIRVTGPVTYDLAYDALGRCVKRTRNNVTTYYIYDGEKAILEYNSGGTLVGRNLYGKGIDEILHRVYGGQTYYFQQDHNGNVTHLTSGAGGVVEKYKYDAFGAVTVYDGSGNLLAGGTAYNNRFLFTGREYAATYAGIHVPEFNFYEYRARAYNPTLGRFMSEDPIGFQIAGEKPSPPASLMFPTQLPKTFAGSEFNLFRYCHNDPIDKTDPTGLYIESAWDVLNIGLGVASLTSNIRQGNWGSAIVDGVGIVVDSAATALPIIPGGAGAAIKAARAADEGAVVIGKMKDLAKPTGWKQGDRVLNLPQKGSPKENWKQNSGRLRETESKGERIKDASTDANGNLRDNTGFTRAERNLLENRGRVYDEQIREWKR
jgi:RHS repeat-associated protein